MYDFLFPKRFRIERIAENTEIKEDIPVLLSEVGEFKPEDELSDINDIEGIMSPKKNDIFEGFDDFNQYSEDDDDMPSFENIDDLDI